MKRLSIWFCILRPLSLSELFVYHTDVLALKSPSRIWLPVFAMLMCVLQLRRAKCEVGGDVYL